MELCSYFAFSEWTGETSYRVFISEDAFLEKERLKNIGTSSEPSFLLTGILLVCFALTFQIEYHIWIYEKLLSVILLLYNPSETLLCCISCVWWISEYEINHFSFVLSMDATMKADIKPLKSFLWISVSKCFDIYKPK